MSSINKNIGDIFAYNKKIEVVRLSPEYINLRISLEFIQEEFN